MCDQVVRAERETSIEPAGGSGGWGRYRAVRNTIGDRKWAEVEDVTPLRFLTHRLNPTPLKPSCLLEWIYFVHLLAYVRCVRERL